MPTFVKFDLSDDDDDDVVVLGVDPDPGVQVTAKTGQTQFRHRLLPHRVGGHGVRVRNIL